MTTLEIIVITMSFSMVIGAYIGYTYGILTDKIINRVEKKGMNRYAGK